MIDQEPVAFKVFDTKKEKFVETTKEIRAVQEAELDDHLRELRRKER